MNLRFLSTNRRVKVFAAVMVLSGTIANDLAGILQSTLSLIKGHNYRQLQKHNLKEEIAFSIDYIKKLQVVYSLDRRESYRKCYAANLYDLYELDSIFQAEKSPTWHDVDLDNFTKLKWKIIRSKSDQLSLYYQDVLHLELLRKIINRIHAIDNGLCLDRFYSVQPDGENKVYFGYGFGCSSRHRQILYINNSKIDGYHHGEIEVPKSDTLNLRLMHITLNQEELDTTIVTKVLVKSGNKWIPHIKP